MARLQQQDVYLVAPPGQNRQRIRQTLKKKRSRLSTPGAGEPTNHQRTHHRGPNLHVSNRRLRLWAASIPSSVRYFCTVRLAILIPLASSMATNC